MSRKNIIDEFLKSNQDALNNNKYNNDLHYLVYNNNNKT